MREKDISILAVGDVLVDRDDPKSIFSLTSKIINKADISFCQLEAALSAIGTPRIGNISHLRSHPRNVAGLEFAGFKVVSFASNNALDYGYEAFFDTIHLLSKKKFLIVGAGKNIDEARKAVIIEKRGTRVAFLSYCSLLQDGFAADIGKAGINRLRIHTFYEPLENVREQPGTPATIITIPNAEHFSEMKEDIKRTRNLADIVITSFHWGIHFSHKLAMYQKDIAHAAIDAGADLVIGHHPHVLQGIEVYKGKAICYSLGNFAFDVSPRIPALRESLAKYLSFYGKEIDPAYPTYPFPAESRQTMILSCTANKSANKVSFLPAVVNNKGQPEIVTPKSKIGKQNFKLMSSLSADLGTTLKIKNDEVIIIG